MKKEGKVRYFLGANSAQGFYSLYDEWVEPKQASALYILKGGPGCGKSTLMRQVGERMEAADLRVEYILCSGDPDSLDGIFIPEKGVAIADGTSPHVIEPAYPGAIGQYVNLGAFYDQKGLFPLRETVIRAEEAYQACYPRAYQCFRAAGEVLQSGQVPALLSSAETKLDKRARSILKREIRQKKTTNGKIRRRFLSALTCQGKLFFRETAELQCKKIYEFWDSCGLSTHLLSRLSDGFVEAGYDVIACPSPLLPQELEHLLVPELSLGFLTVSPQNSGKHPDRHIQLDTLPDKELLRAHKSRVRFSRRIAEELVEDGIHSLTQAKEKHDALEAIYHPFVAFQKVDLMTQTLTEAILALP